MQKFFNCQVSKHGVFSDKKIRYLSRCENYIFKPISSERTTNKRCNIATWSMTNLVRCKGEQCHIIFQK